MTQSDDMSAFELELTVCAGGNGHVTTTVAVPTAEELESLAAMTAAAIGSWQIEREQKGLPSDSALTSGLTVVGRMGKWLDRMEAAGQTVTIEGVRLHLELALWSEDDPQMDNPLEEWPGG